MDLSVIIVCHKGWMRLYKCLDSLSTIDDERLSFEVIVADNKSDDDEILRVREKYPGFKFILNTVNGGFGYGCNTGARSASGKFLMFLNPDTAVTGDALASLIKVKQQNPEFTILSCKQVNERGKESHATADFPSFRNLTGIMRTIFRRRNIPDNGHEIVFPDWVSGSLIMISRDDFIKTGGFDEDFWMYFEDVDLCRRVTDSAGKIAFHRNITIEHNHGGSSRINLRTTSLTKTEVMISRHVYFSKHTKGLNLMLAESFMVINNLTTCAVMAVPGIILFFIPKAFVRVPVFTRLCFYYLNALTSLTWISPRAVRKLP